MKSKVLNYSIEYYGFRDSRQIFEDISVRGIDGFQMTDEVIDFPLSKRYDD